jgi:hypothetical protein
MDNFTRAYIEALFWTEQDNLPDATDLATEAMAKISRDCEEFQTRNAATLEAAYKIEDYNEAQAGHDFWLTRNHHGAGFWDRGLDVVGKELTAAAHTFPEVSPYVGDNGEVFV